MQALKLIFNNYSILYDKDTDIIENIHIFTFLGGIKFVLRMPFHTLRLKH